jgi:hypothetical protein
LVANTIYQTAQNISGFVLSPLPTYVELPVLSTFLLNSGI